MSNLQGFPITFSIYAENEQEAQEARDAIVAFITSHAVHGRAVTGKKLTQALRGWDKNPFIKNQVINFLKD